MANGEKLQCKFICEGFEWRIQGQEFKGDVYFLPLDNYDWILGIQWLTTLGYILWNFEELRMTFTNEGQQQTFQGLDSKGLSFMGSSKMQKLLGKDSQVAATQLI